MVPYFEIAKITGLFTKGYITNNPLYNPTLDLPMYVPSIQNLYLPGISAISLLIAVLFTVITRLYLGKWSVVSKLI